MSATTSATIKPVTFRLPKPGKGDPFFGYSRAHYYTLERRGVITLIRDCEDGKDRGVTLIPFEQVERFVREKMEEQNGGLEAQDRVHASGNRQSEQPRGEKSEQDHRE